MAHIKTIISLPKSLLDQVNALAHAKKVSRSRVFVLALEEYLRREESRNLAAQITAVYSEPDPEIEALRRKMKRHYRQLIEAEDRV